MATRKKRRKSKKLRPTTLIRRWVQFAFASFILIASLRHSISIEHLPSIDSYCPFGMVETLWQFASTGTFVQKTHPSNLVLGIGLLLSALLAGATFCGWICPFGALHDLLTWVRDKLKLPELNVPDKLDKILTYGRYVVLIGILYQTIVTATLWFADYDPYRTIFSLNWLFEFDLAKHWPAYLIALAIIAGGFFIPRFWCRYLCPQGLLLGLLQRISLIKIWRNPSGCLGCKLCDIACPAKLDIASANVILGDCIGCLECVATCPPKAGSLIVSLGRPRLSPRKETA
jgi:polyferredoxin